MRKENVRCPMCGTMNYDVDLDETGGWTKCRLCKAVTCSMAVSYTHLDVYKRQASPGVDHTGEDLAAVLAPNHVSHNFVCPAILCLYLLQWAGGFLLHQFKFCLLYTSRCV